MRDNAVRKSCASKQKNHALPHNSKLINSDLKLNAAKVACPLPHVPKLLKRQQKLERGAKEEAALQVPLPTPYRVKLKKL
jgi:hypothetical protein